MGTDTAVHQHPTVHSRCPRCHAEIPALGVMEFSEGRGSCHNCGHVIAPTANPDPHQVATTPAA